MYQAIYCIFLAAFANAGLALYITDCMRPGMIFGWWLPWLSRMAAPSDSEALQAALDACESRRDMDAVMIEWGLENVWWLKPMGGCVQCFAPYLTAATFVGLWYGVGLELNAWAAFGLYLAFSVGWLRVLVK